MVVIQLFKEIHNEQLAEGAIHNELMEGFREDYLALHCLLRFYKPKTVFEIGTHIGTGTKIICNAVPDAKVCSLDLPDEMHKLSEQHPASISWGTNKVGHVCNLPYVQLYGDSLKFNYNEHQSEAWWIDGEHDYMHALHEAREAIKTGAKLIMFHDADMDEVDDAIKEAFDGNKDYQVYRVIDTRIAYAVKKEI